MKAGIVGIVGMSYAPPPLIAHRGASAHAPENTLAAFRLAAEMGAGWVEFDCMLCADAGIIIHHDETLERTTNGAGAVAETALCAIRKLDAGSWFHPRFADQTVPTMAEAVALLSACGLGANVEIKPTRGRDAVTGRLVGEWLAAYWPADLPPPLLSSFSGDALDAAARACPDVARALLLTGLPPDWRRRAERVGAASLHLDAARLRDRDARELAAQGMVFRCYTVNDPARAARLFELGAQSVITDDPQRLAKAGF